MPFSQVLREGAAHTWVLLQPLSGAERHGAIMGSPAHARSAVGPALAVGEAFVASHPARERTPMC